MKSAFAILVGAVALPFCLGATAGLQLRLPGKSPLLIRTLDSADELEPLPLKEPLLYLGGSLTWRPLSKTAEIDLVGNKALLMLEESSAWLDHRRIAIPAPLRWKDGRLVLSRAAMELVFRALSPAAPEFSSASAQELAAAGAEPQVPAAEPAVVQPPEPIIIPMRGSGSQGRPSTGKLRLVVVDAGHGGYDPGAHGHGGVDEKDVCLDIARRLAAQIRSKMPGVEVLLTRDSDNFVTLRERTKIANEANADLFISIHNNASPNSKSRGSQVFFYDSRSSDRAAEDLARRENEDANYLEFIMMDLTKSLVREQSIMLAQSVQDQLAEVGQGFGVKKRSLSYAPFYVLARTKMPAILVEVAFITNPREERLLANSGFRSQIADGILSGLQTYKVSLAKP